MKKLTAEETLQALIRVNSNARWDLFCQMVEENRLTKEGFNVGLKDAYTTGRYDYRAYDYFELADKSLMMSKEENEYFDKLPDTVTVYRGASSMEFEDECPNFGLSWTTEQKVAEFFAFRGRGCNVEDGRVYRVVVDKDDIKAVFLDRQEAEVIITYSLELDYAEIITDKPTALFYQHQQERS